MKRLKKLENVNKNIVINNENKGLINDQEDINKVYSLEDLYFGIVGNLEILEDEKKYRLKKREYNNIEFAYKQDTLQLLYKQELVFEYTKFNSAFSNLEFCSYYDKAPILFLKERDLVFLPIDLLSKHMPLKYRIKGFIKADELLDLCSQLESEINNIMVDLVIEDQNVAEFNRHIVNGLDFQRRCISKNPNTPKIKTLSKNYLKIL